MTHQTVEKTGAHVEPRTSSAFLPALVSSILAVIWGAYTVTYLVEVLSMPFPAL